MAENLWAAFVANNGSNEILVDSSADGKSWTGSRFINQWSPFAPALAFFNGSLYVAFITDDAVVSGNKSIPSNRIFICSTADGVSWSPAVFSGQYSKCAPALAAWNNRLYLSFVSNDELNKVLVCALPAGEGWGPAVDTLQATRRAPTLASFAPAGGTGFLCLAFVAANPSNSILVCTFDGSSWSPHAVTGQACLYSPSLQAFNATLYLGFAENGPKKEILLSSSTTGTQWSTPYSINQSTAASPSLAVFSNPANFCVGFAAHNSDLECLLASSLSPANAASWPTTNADIQQSTSTALALAVAPFACVAKMVPAPGRGLKSAGNYFIWGGSCTPAVNLTNLVLTVDVGSSILSTNGFSVQWNGYCPEGAAGTTWQQYGFLVDKIGNIKGWVDNWPSHALRTQLYPPGSKSDLINDYFTMATLPTPTLPAGYQLVIQLTNDVADKIIAGEWSIYDNNSNLVAQASRNLYQETVSNDRSLTVDYSWLAPLVAFNVVVVGTANKATAQFLYGQGTVSVTSDQLMIAANRQPHCTSSQGGGTGEKGDSLYSQLPDGYSKRMTQPFSLGPA